MYTVERATFPADLNAVLDLYREYIANTSVDLAFQGNDEEFNSLSEKYSSDESKIFLATINKIPVGCAAFRKVNDNTCEMKRVYVRPTARGSKLGARLVERILQEAISSGYKKICLDVLPEFETALALYQSYGFVPHTPVTNNPVPGTQFLGLDLEWYNHASSEPKTRYAPSS
ncbi:GNAT family N-acetyltransferase [Vreelandella zhaodongensis]|uniref:GNAT family N-acetyltransferase n=1 Tax=Vreelandella zhaodongensis TaxID=1176240 RepID=A0ABX2SSY1_VREZH|nr:GNAT family N-acetyltransferase [Halomonas zhaodongensis]